MSRGSHQALSLSRYVFGRELQVKVAAKSKLPRNSTRNDGQYTPSVAAMGKNNERFVGQAAKRQAVTNPENEIFFNQKVYGAKIVKCQRRSQAIYCRR
jgi:molecular chaperone DnaK (HSP70)